MPAGNGIVPLSRIPWGVSGVVRRILARLWPTVAAYALIQDSLIYGASKVIPGLVGFASVVVFVRITGPEEYGRYMLIAAIVNLWASAAGGWFYQGLLRHLHGWDLESRSLRHLVGLGLAACGAAGVTASVIQLTWAPGTSFGDVISGAALVVATIGQAIVLGIWQAKLKPQLVIWIELVRSLAVLGVSAVLGVLWGGTAQALLWGAFLGTSLSVIVANIPVDREFGSGLPRPLTHCLSDIWAYGWPLSLWFGGQLSFQWLDRAMIQQKFGLATTGLFAGWSDIITRSYSLFIFPIALAVYPRMAVAWNEGRSRDAARMLKISAVLMLVAAAPLTIGLALWRVPLFERALHTRDLAAAEPTLLLALGGFLWQLALLAHKPLELRNRTKLMASAMLAALAIKAALNWIALPTLGLNGVAYATISATVVYCGLCWLFSLMVRFPVAAEKPCW